MHIVEMEKKVSQLIYTYGVLFDQPTSARAI